MYLSQSTAICCIQWLVIKSTSCIQLGIRYSKKSYLLQQKYLQCYYFNLHVCPSLFPCHVTSCPTTSHLLQYPANIFAVIDMTFCCTSLQDVVQIYFQQPKTYTANWCTMTQVQQRSHTFYYFFSYMANRM